MIEKSAKLKSVEVGDDIMHDINKYSLENLSAEAVFVFKVIMCDNEIDRTFEYFTDGALAKLGELFVGKTVIADHKRTVENQTARIFRTEIFHDETTKNFRNEPYTQLIAYCYMLSNEKNADIIAEIKGGIRKEVSVGFMVGSVVCSICGADNLKTYCQHWPGRSYDGETCYFELRDPTDAYELSFVAVPAQPKASVTKEYKPGDDPPPDNLPEEELKNIERAKKRFCDLALFVRLKNLESEE